MKRNPRFLPDGAFAIVALAASVDTFRELHNLGFPDGHLTEYERGIRTPLFILAGCQLCAFLLFTSLGIASQRFEFGGKMQKGVLSIFLFSLICQHLLIPWYFLTYLRLENGQGG